ncbi:MAG: hypothetical protein ACI8T1_001522 [Verrucomicrobiales bacterium]
MVTTSVDENNGIENGGVSLREAIATANGGDRIRFAAFLDDQTISLTGTELLIDKSLIIDGSDLFAGIRISGSGSSRVLSVANGAVVTLDSLEIEGGVAATGAGLLVDGGATVTVLNTTIYANVSDPGEGAGIMNLGTLVMVNSTISGNSASANSGGGLTNRGLATLRQVTIAGNSATLGGGIYQPSGVQVALVLENCVVAGNAASSTTPDVYRQVATTEVTSISANLIGDHTSVETVFPVGPLAGNAASPLDANLALLDDFGGPTQSMALLVGSPARNAGVLTGDTTLTDQRSFPRMLGAGLDLGAFESGNGEYRPEGLSLYSSILQPDLAAGGVEFQISVSPVFQRTVGTIAGAGVAGDADGPATSASFNLPSGVAEDSAGFLFVTDPVNQRIRMISPQGEVSTIAGNGEFGFVDGAGTEAEFKFPSSIAVGPDNNLYVSDTLNHSIRKLSRPEAPGLPWTVITVAGSGRAGFMNGIGAFAQFRLPYGLTLDSSGNIYVADSSNHRIRKVSPNGAVSTFAGIGISGLLEGSRLNAQFSSPFDVAFDSVGDLFVADRENHRIRRISVSDQVTTAAGFSAGFTDGVATPQRPATLALFNNPTGVALDAADNLVVADLGNHAIRKVTRPPSGFLGVWSVSTLAGTGAAGFVDGITGVAGAQFNCPTDLTVASDGALIIADERNHRIRRLGDPLGVPGSLGTADQFGQAFSSVIDFAPLGLMTSTEYYVRAVASDGSIQSTGESFTTAEASVDTWAMDVFGGDANDPQIAGLTANPDGDAFDNLQEYAFGLDPNTISGNPTILTREADGSATVTYPRRVGGTGLTYRVEWSTDRDVWRVDGITEIVLVGQAGGPTENVVATIASSVIDASLASDLRIFIRVTVTLF